MSSETEIMLSGSRMGRIVLHVMVMLMDHSVGRHWAGIRREIKGV